MTGKDELPVVIIGQEGPQNPQLPPMNLCLLSTLVLHHGLVLVWLEVQLVKVVFLWMKGKTQPWLGAGPPMVVHLAAITEGMTVLVAVLGTGEGVVVELSRYRVTGRRVVLVAA